MFTKHSRTPSTASTVQAIEALLETLSGLPPTKRCPRCASAMGHKDATLFFPKGEKGWTIPLAFCPNCDSTAERSPALS